VLGIQRKSLSSWTLRSGDSFKKHLWSTLILYKSSGVLALVCEHQLYAFLSNTPFSGGVLMACGGKYLHHRNGQKPQLESQWLITSSPL
jgi:hypothetical protein